MRPNHNSNAHCYPGYASRSGGAWRVYFGATAIRTSVETPPPLAPNADVAASRAVEKMLRERFPAVFCDPPKPLAIGVYKQIVAAAEGDIDRHALRH